MITIGGVAALYNEGVYQFAERLDETKTILLDRGMEDEAGVVGAARSRLTSLAADVEELQNEAHGAQHLVGEIVYERARGDRLTKQVGDLVASYDALIQYAASQGWDEVPIGAIIGAFTVSIGAVRAARTEEAAE